MIRWFDGNIAKMYNAGEKGFTLWRFILRAHLTVEVIT